LSDPRIILSRLQDISADLRHWCSRVSDALDETIVCKNYSKEMSDRMEQKYHVIIHEINDSKMKENDLNMVVSEQESELHLTERRVSDLDQTGKSTSTQVAQINEECTTELAKAEAKYERAIVAEKMAVSWLEKCKDTLHICEQNVNNAISCLRDAEAELSKAISDLKSAKKQNPPINLAPLQARVSAAEAEVASCRKQCQIAEQERKQARKAYEEANGALQAAIRDRQLAERRRENCRKAIQFAQQASVFSGLAIEWTIHAMQETSALASENERAKESCRYIHETLEKCKQEARQIRNELDKSWNVFTSLCRSCEESLRNGEEGMGTCQQAILELNRRSESLARFEATNVR